MSDEKTPGAPAGPPTELQQLEAALAAGAITPELFSTLRSQLRPAALGAVPVPPAASEELPPLLELFNQPLAPPVLPAAAPSTASPVAALAEDVAARQRIEAQLAQLRQKPPVAAPSFLPEPRPAPAFLPEPQVAPSFLPEPRPALPEPHPALSFLPATPPPAPPAAPAAPSVQEAPASGSRLPFWLLVLAALGALAYFFTRSSHPDESLTSPRDAAANPAPTAAAPKAARHNKSSKKQPRHKRQPAALPASPPAAHEVAAASPATEKTAVAAGSAPAAAFGEPVPAAPEATDDAAAGKVRAVMAAYYADLFAPPMHASEHFAPQVERLYIQYNLTPAAIDAALNRGFFPDNQHAVYQIEPGTLRVSPPVADGSRVATFTEAVRLYRVSQQRFQRLRTQVRVRFNADYQILYLRQEKLLANEFEQ